MFVRRLGSALSPGLLPFSWAALFAVFAVIYRMLDMPDPSEVVATTRFLFDQYGLFVLIPAAFLEGIFMISIYFPGSLVVVIAIFLSNKSPEALLSIGFFSWIGFSAALPLNYYLGREGFYRALLALGRKDTVERMQAWLDRRGKWALFLSAFHPNILAVAMVCMGIAHEGMKKSVSIGATSMFPWLILVIGVLGIVTDEIDVTDRNQAWYFVGLLLFWGLILVLKEKRWRATLK